MMDETVKLQEAEKMIRELFEEFSKEGIRLKLLQDNNSSKIGELEENILQLTKNEDVDYRFFSPRNVVSNNKGKIDDLRDEKEDLQKSNKSIFKQMTYYKEKADKLEQIKNLLERTVDDRINKNVKLDSIDQEEKEVNTFKTIEDVKVSEKKSVIEASLPSELERINHKLDLCGKFIENDPVRAKIEIKSIMRNLDDIIISIQ